jgi:hypothetical protein
MESTSNGLAALESNRLRRRAGCAVSIIHLTVTVTVTVLLCFAPLCFALLCSALV